MKGQTSIYFAAPLFTQAEWQWNEALANQLEKKHFVIHLPQKLAEPMLAKKVKFNARSLFYANIEAIQKADVILAILDQPDPDSGTCWECGYAFKIGKPIIGLRTDLRKSSDGPKGSINLMLELSCRHLIVLPLEKRNDIKWVSRECDKAIRNAIT